eukprot:COSAG02_NODE_340_length_24179_cov_6.401644_22_plen_74_part_00
MLTGRRMPRNWDQEYHQRIHKKNLKAVKGKVQAGSGAGRRGGRAAGKKGSFQEQGDGESCSAIARHYLPMIDC